MKNEYLFLIWKDPNTRRNFTIGKLSSGEKFTFCYLPDAAEAKKFGWSFLNSFPEDKEYSSEVLFPAFSSRLPDRKRRDIDKILLKYGMSHFDEFELLKKSGARLPIDTYEFIDPIFPEDKTIQREFFVMGIRHHAPCNGKDCERLPVLEKGNELKLVPEPENTHDKFAIRVETQNGIHIGYIPRYYNQQVLARINTGVTYSCTVIEVLQNNICSECVKVRLLIPKDN